MDFYAFMFVGNLGYSYYEYDDIFLVFQCELNSNTEHDKRQHEMSHFSFFGKVKLPRDSAKVSPYSFLGKVKLPRDYAFSPFTLVCVCTSFQNHLLAISLPIFIGLS
jgi:hypothetical protein